MTNEVAVRDDGATFLEARRNVLLWPAVLATLIGGGLLALWLVAGVATAIAVHDHPQWLNPNGAVVLHQSRTEEIRGWIRFLLPVVLGAIALLLTWRFRGNGQRAATCVCAAATILLGLYCWW